jgi:hypothetical protein
VLLRYYSPGPCQVGPLPSVPFPPVPAAVAAPCLPSHGPVPPKLFCELGGWGWVHWTFTSRWEWGSLAIGDGEATSRLFSRVCARGQNSGVRVPGSMAMWNKPDVELCAGS